MTRVGTSRKETILLFTIFAYIFMGAGLSSFFLPAVQVKVPPLGEKEWSLKDIVSPLPKALAPKKKKSGFKLDPDFADVLQKLAPQTSEGKPQKISLTFVVGVLVPVALAFAYFFLILSLFLLGFKLHRFLKGSLTGAVFTSLYGVLGIYWLGLRASQSFHAATAKAAEGALGFIAKNMVPEISISPGFGLYVLAGAAGISWFCLLFIKK